ncbi:MAG: DUF624 domain-containing protein [Firmicutes bacterium]|nr:DUF624 domain-containing protein [Bacillota bacterium]
MNFFERLVNSGINTVADWIIRLIMINIMIIFCSLLVVTIYPAFSAGYNLLHDYIEHKSPRMFHDYFTYFKTNIWRKILFGLLIFLVFGLGYSNIRYYTLIIEEQLNWFNRLGYYVTLALLATAYAVTLYSLVVMYVNPKLKFMNTIKLSFFLAGKYYFTTLALVLVNTIPLFLLFSPLTTVVLVFAGISIPLTAHALLTRNALTYLEKIGENNG